MRSTGRLRPLPPSPESFLGRNPPAPRVEAAGPRPGGRPQARLVWPTDRRRFAPVPAERTEERNAASLRLYRSLVRAVVAFPVERLRAKLRFNISEAFQLQRTERDPERLAQLYAHGDTALRLLRATTRLDQRALEMLFSRALNVDHQFHGAKKDERAETDAPPPEPAQRAPDAANP